MDEWVTVKDAAADADVGQEAIRSWIRRRLLDSRLENRKTVVPLSAVRELVATIPNVDRRPK